MPSPTSKPQSGFRHHHHHQQPPQDSPRHGSSHGPDTSAAAHSHVPSSHGALPLSFRRLPFQSSHHPPPSTSLVPSVAEGRPIPVDDSTAEHRTEALREFNSHYPSRHRYAKSTGAENTTYSEPVIVRSYYRSPPNRANRLPPRGGANSSGSGSQGGIVVVRNGHSTAGSVNGSVASRTRASPLAGKMASASSGMLSIMARARGQNSRPAAHRALPEDARLPPIEAFSFKSFLENLDEEAEAAAAAANGTSSSDINADLDRIAEICARSRYSLSNQYEVHYGPHGSGTAFVAEGGGSQGPQHNHHHQGGPTLQAVTSDDETNTRTARKRRLGGGARRNSRAMGTLETIMSSSRSSDDDRSKKKSAADIADEVRGRASAKTSHHTSPAGSTASARAQQQQDQPTLKKQRPGVKRTPSSSLALIDAAGKTTTGPSTGGESTPHSASVVSLVGEPALPQPCTSQLQVHTATARADAAAGPDGVSAVAQHPSTAAAAANPLPCPATHGAVSAVVVDGATATGFLSTLAGWIPWSTGSASTDATLRPQQGRAAGSLRSLLRIADDNNDTHCHH